ncbi:Superoxide dismutase [Cu-Zn] [Perkinsus olseni]|uniref:Superoxide dismutase [Cu-Zn] n=1 Tax=Perkinsus olseni TaxID=32597 RepID=A0A7J6RHQ0_PEROL|nr:Superoxide dismutase [Cu-Zn] [Perkinsus olseni]
MLFTSNVAYAAAILGALTLSSACANACHNVCLWIGGCGDAGSHCQNYLPPPHACEDLYIEKTNVDGGATICSARSGQCSSTKHPLKCLDISPFDPETPPKYPLKAKSVLEPHDSGAPRRGARIARGTFHYTQHGPQNTTITYEITGLEPNSSHGIYVHESARFTPSGCNSAGMHYNPYQYQHGGPDDDIRHLGTLGNAVADASGVARGSLTSRIIKLEGAFSVLHRSTMVHAYPDDFRNERSSGARLACGEILPE